MSLMLTKIAEDSAHLAPLAGRGPHGKKEDQNSARVRGPLHDSELLRLVEGPPHPDLLHSPSKTGVNALVARGEKETASRLGRFETSLRVRTLWIGFAHSATTTPPGGSVTRHQGRSMPLRLSTSSAACDCRKLTRARAVSASFA